MWSSQITRNLINIKMMKIRSHLHDNVLLLFVLDRTQHSAGWTKKLSKVMVIARMMMTIILWKYQLSTHKGCSTTILRDRQTDEGQQILKKKLHFGYLFKNMFSFQAAFHGRTFGALSATRSKPIHKLDMPAFKWPVAPFPQYKYPLECYASENKEEDMK